MSKPIKTVTQIKQEMALPPIPQAPPKERKDRDRSRIRMEIGCDQCSALVEVIHAQIKNTPVGSPEFQPLYSLYYSLKTQLAKVVKNA